MAKKNGKRNQKKGNSSISKKALNSAILDSSETKLQKDIVDLTVPGTPQSITGSFWMTPYNSVWTSMIKDGTNLLNPTVESSGLTVLNIGNFITNGAGRDQRVGRRISMMNANIRLVLHIRALEVDGSYTYNMNPEFRVIQGWVKGGIDSLEALATDITTLYSEVNYSRYKVIKDYIITRTGRSAMTGYGSGAYNDANAVLTYGTIKLNFNWRPNGHHITFDDTNAGVGNGTKYDGWVPFAYVLNPHSNLQLSVDFCKRVNAFKDI